MWLLTLITLLNAAANNKTFVLEYRFSIDILPLNIFDILLLVALPFMAFRGSGRFPTEGVHRAMKWLMVLFAGATVAGVLGSLGNGAYFRDVANIGRNFVAMPLCIFIGYNYLQTPRSAARYPYVFVLAGLITGLMILLFFVGQTELRAASGNVNILRTVDYVSSYAGVAGVFVLFTIVGGVKLMPKPLAFVIGGAALLGDFATLSRSDWIASAAAMGAMFLLLPPGQRIAKALKVTALLICVLGVLYLGVAGTSRLTGWDFAGKVENKLLSLLPGQREGWTDLERNRAWDTRLPGIIRELEMYTESPILGRGFGAQIVEERRAGQTLGFYHNVWSSTLCHAGPLGLAAMALAVGSCIVIGRRLVRERIDRGSVLMGALGVIAGVYYLVYGMATLSFNTLRGAIPLGLICGAVLRARAMQLALVRQYAGYLPDSAEQQHQHGAGEELTPMLDGYGQPSGFGLEAAAADQRQARAAAAATTDPYAFHRAGIN